MQHSGFRGDGGKSEKWPLILAAARLVSSLLVVACVSGRKAHAGAEMAVLPVSAGTAYLSIEGVPPETAAAASADGEWILYLDGDFDSGADVRLAGFIVQQKIRQASVYIGIHRVANRVPVSDEHAFDQVVSGQATQYLSDMSISHELFRMMELVPHEQIRLLTYEEAQKLKLVSD